MILEKKETKAFVENNSDSLVTTKQLLALLERQPLFKKELIRVFEIDEQNEDVLEIGNSRHLLESLLHIDSQCEKIDISAKIKDIRLLKMLEAEKAIFEISSVTHPTILSKNKSDLLSVETRYSSKNDILDYYNFSKFANYCRDKEFEDLIDNVKAYLNDKNSDNHEQKSLRVIYKKDDAKFYLRAVTSSEDYKDFGINFSVFVALKSLGKYVSETKSPIYINRYTVDESNLYVSFVLDNEVEVSKNMTLAFSLILENDEIKRGAVSFNGFFKLKLNDGGQSSEIFLKPKGLKKDNIAYPVELLSYQHRGSVAKVFEKISELPIMIDFFIRQVTEDASRISKIENPDDVRKHIMLKVKHAKKPEFQVYKDTVFKRLMSVTVDNTFKLFELLRTVEELFEHEDVVSRDFWRTKLYETLIERK